MSDQEIDIRTLPLPSPCPSCGVEIIYGPPGTVKNKDPKVALYGRFLYDINFCPKCDVYLFSQGQNETTWTRTIKSSLVGTYRGKK